MQNILDTLSVTFAVQYYRSVNQDWEFTTSMPRADYEKLTVGDVLDFEDWPTEIPVNARLTSDVFTVKHIDGTLVTLGAE